MILQGDCVEKMRELDEASVDAVVCDPPYGLEFMGKKWDRLGDAGQVSHSGFADEKGFKGFRLASYSGSGNLKCRRCNKWTYDHPGRKCECPTPDVDRAHQSRLQQEWHHTWATEALRVLKPGGHLLAFGGTRTYHRLACAVEDAGFEIRDSVIWLYGSGFPKSLNLNGDWQGWGTALKPSHEPIVVARKPLAGTVAATVLEYGTGALNVDGCRIGTDEDRSRPPGQQSANTYDLSSRTEWSESNPAGRWPSNVVLSHLPECEQEFCAPDCPVSALDAQSGETTAGIQGGGGAGGIWNPSADGVPVAPSYGDTGGASRFFYVAKSSRSERTAGVDANVHPT